jgi:hypothetical protein
MAKTARTKEEVIKAIQGSGGIKTVIAGRLGVARITVDTYLDRWKVVQEAYNQEVETTKDYAESAIVGNIRLAAKMAAQGNQAETGDAWKYLQMKAKERGYVPRQETEHSGSIDVRKLSDDELLNIIEG